jgi:hypothetical protein
MLCSRGDRDSSPREAERVTIPHPHSTLLVLESVACDEEHSTGQETKNLVACASLDDSSQCVR